MNRQDIIERLEEMETYLLNKSYSDLRARDFYEWIGCALELLKSQEPVEPHYKKLAILGQWDTLPICGACGTIIGYCVKYCPHCGREVGWPQSP
jgi:hypothetical protein